MNINLDELGQRRLDVMKTATTAEEFQSQWPKQTEEYPFAWSEYWKASMTFRVPDFPSEFAFFLDLLGFRLFSHWEDHAMISSPDRAYIITLGKAENRDRFDPSNVQLDMMLGNLAEATAALRLRDIELIADMEQESPVSPMKITTFKTPNGILVKLWGMDMPQEG